MLITCNDIALNDISLSAIALGPIPRAGSTVVYNWGALGLPASVGSTATLPTIGDAVGNRLALVWPDRWIPVKAEELRYNGWRRVENLLPASEDLTDASWSNGDTETTAELNNTAAVAYTFSGTYLSGTTFTFRAKISSSTPGADVRFRVENDSGVDSGSIFEVSSTPTVYSSTITLTDDATNKEFRIQNQSGETVTFTIEEMQVENVTGQSNQNPAEYVSTGVATGDELILAQGTSQWVPQGSNTVTDGGDGSVLITYVNNSGGAQLHFDEDDGTTAAEQVIGKTYVVTGQAKVNTGGVTLVVNGLSGTPNKFISSTSYMDFRFVATCTSTSAFNLVAQSMGAGETINIRNVSLKVADHGWNVDGVKYFATENGNTVSSNVVTEATGSAIAAATLKGYFGEGAATELSGYSADLTNWSVVNTPTVAQDATGLSGAGNEAFTVTDNDGSNYEYLQVFTTITSGSDTYYMVVRVAYDASPTTYPFINFLIRAGTEITQSVIFDPSDGSYTEVNTDGSVVSVARVGDFWTLILSLTDNASGNNSARMYLYPAGSTNGTTVSSSATGSTVFASAELYKTNYSFSPILTTGGTTKSRLADSQTTLPFTFPQDAGSIEVDFTSYFDSSSGSQGILSAHNVVTSNVLYFTSSPTIRSYDGTTIVTLTDAPTTGTTRSIKLRWGNGTFNLSVDGVKATEQSYDGGYVSSPPVSLLNGLLAGAAIKNLVVYNEDKGDAWLEE